MAKSTRKSPTGKRGPGRPRLGSVQVNVSLPAALAAGLDAWIRQQRDPELSRTEAIRRFIELGLAAKPKR